MKILLVDIDGVFNSGEGDYIKTVPSPSMKAPAIVNINAVQMFNHLVWQCPDVRLVASSTWRLHFDTLPEFCEKTLLDEDLFHRDWRTSQIGFSGESNNRAQEILDWIEDHPEVTQFIAIDDIKFPPSIPSILCDEIYGITLDQMIEVFDRLGYHVFHTAEEGWHVHRKPAKLDWEESLL